MRVSILTILALLVIACGESSSDAGTVFELEDVVVLDESEAEPIGQPVHIAVDLEGRIALTDRLKPGVILFTARGERQGSFGSQGTGPGEIERAILGVFLADDRIGVVGEGERPAIVVYDATSGAHVETLPLRTLPWSVTPIEDGFLFGILDFGTSTSVMEFDLPTAQERAFGPVPSAYQEGGPLAGIFNRVHAARTERGITVIGFEPLQDLVLEQEESERREVLRVPALHRRGTPDNLQERLREAMRGSYPEVFAQGSVLSLVAAVDADRILLVHQDLLPELPAIPEAVWVSIVDLNDRAACVDVPLPFNPEAPATFTSQGGRLGVLQQEIDIESGEAPTVLRWYRVNGDACSWCPSRNPPPESAHGYEPGRS